MSSKKPPLHPVVARCRREAIQGFTITGLALSVGPIVALVSLALWQLLDAGDAAGTIAALGIPAWLLFAGPAVAIELSEAQGRWNNYKETMDQQKWNAYQAENERLQRIIKEQGWANE